MYAVRRDTQSLLRVQSEDTKPYLLFAINLYPANVEYRVSY